MEENPNVWLWLLEIQGLSEVNAYSTGGMGLAAQVDAPGFDLPYPSQLTGYSSLKFASSLYMISLPFSPPLRIS